MTRASGRRPSLDGLRGLAAVLVVVHHTLLLDPIWANTYATPRTGSWLVLHSPLRLLWAGEVAVAVFFALSGFVLARPFLGERERRWRAYYPKRLLRLYLPVFAAVAFACVLVLLVPRRPQPGRAWWFDSHVVQVDSQALWDASLWSFSGLNSSLWSLKWEVAFSLALPLFVAATRVARRYPAGVVVAALLTLCTAGWALGSPALQYLPVFGLGVLAADREEAAARLAEGMSRRAWVVLGLATVALTTVAVYPLQALGALLVLLGATHCARVVGWVSQPVMVWLGKVSFSLYLVHLPLIYVLVDLLPGWSAPELLVLTLPVSLCAAVLFHRLVELPSLNLATRAATPWSTAEAPSSSGLRACELPSGV